MTAAVSQLPLPPDSEQEFKQRVLSGNFEVTLQQSNQRTNSLKSLQFKGPIYTDDTIEDVNARVDLYQSIVDRQVVISDIRSKEEYIEGELINLDLMAKQKEALDKKFEAGAKPTSTEKEKVRQYQGARDAALDRIAKLQAEIVKAKQKNGLE